MTDLNMLMWNLCCLHTPSIGTESGSVCAPFVDALVFKRQFFGKAEDAISMYWFFDNAAYPCAVFFSPSGSRNVNQV